MEPCSESQADKIGQEKQQEEEAQKEEVEVPYQPAGCLMQEEEPGEQPLSPDHDGMQEVTSEGGLEQVQREETQIQEKRESFSHITVNQESRKGESGV